jgi:hypothetical protein
MSFFKNMDQPESNDISQLPAYAALPEEKRREVNDRYSSVYNNNQRMGVRIAQGMAFEAAKQMCESYIEEKHIGFKKLQGQLEKQGHSKESAGAIAASIGRKKYGAKAMASHKPLGESEDEHSCPSCGSSEHLSFHPYDFGHDRETGYSDSGERFKCHGPNCGAEGDAEDTAPKPKMHETEDEHIEYEPTKDYKKSAKGDSYGGGDDDSVAENAETFQAANDNLVGMTEADYSSISNGDHVTIKTPQGQHQRGKAVMKGPGGWVLNLGGKHGTPGIANEKNYVKHTSAKKKAPNSLAMRRLVGEGEGDPEDSGAKGIQAKNHKDKCPDCKKDPCVCVEKARNEALDPMIAAAAGYIQHRQEVSGLMEDKNAPKKKWKIVDMTTGRHVDTVHATTKTAAKSAASKKGHDSRFHTAIEHE